MLGPYGFAANAIYSGVDMTVGWPAMGRTALDHKVMTGFSPVVLGR